MVGTSGGTGGGGGWKVRMGDRAGGYIGVGGGGAK